MLRPRILSASRQLSARLGPAARSRALCATRRRPIPPRTPSPAPPAGIAAQGRAYSDSAASAEHSSDGEPPLIQKVAPRRRTRLWDHLPERLRRPQNIPNVPLAWLRDACPCERCVDPHSGQKSFATPEAPSHPSLVSAHVDADGTLRVRWALDPLSRDADGLHDSVYAPPLLRRLGAREKPRATVRLPWDGRVLTEQLPQCRISYDEWMAGGAAFERAFRSLERVGLVFVHGVPASETAVQDVGRQLGGDLLHTFYGLTWDVVSKPRAENVAYTSQFLDLHQDLLYYADPPKIQLLHCLANECGGGESLFSDGLRAALWLRRARPRHFDALTSQFVPYHYDKNGHDFQYRRPTIELHHGHGSNNNDHNNNSNKYNSNAAQKHSDDARAVRSVWWSPPFQDVLQLGSPSTAWHEAARSFWQAIRAPENLYQYKMRAGECVVFDNHRVLHGRRQFDTGAGTRWLKGTYVSTQTFGMKGRRIRERQPDWEGYALASDVARLERQALEIS